jgi:hypothetical protein
MDETSEKDSEKARVCAWCFDLQLKSEQKDASDCLRNILLDAQISNRVPLDMVSFAWSPHADGPLVDIFGFFRAHRQVREGTLETWIQDDRIPNQVTWTPCAVDPGKDWTTHPLITEYLTKSGSNREFWKWNAESSKLEPCHGMPTASKRGRPPKKHADGAPGESSDQTAAGESAVQSGSSAIPSAKRRRKPSQTAAGDGGSSSPPPKRKSAPVPAAQSSSQLLQQGMSDTEAIDQIRKLPLDTLRALWRDHYVAEKTVPRNKQDCLAAIFDRVPAMVVYQAAMRVFGAQAFGSAGAAAAQPATEAGVATASAAESAAAAGSAAQHGRPRGRPAASVSAETVPQQPSPFPPPTPPPPPPTAAAAGGASAPALANTSPPQAATHAAQASYASYAAAAGGGGLMTPGPPQPAAAASLPTIPTPAPRPPPPRREGAGAAGAAAGRAELSVSCYLFVSSDCMRQCSNSSITDNVQQAE